MRVQNKGVGSDYIRGKYEIVANNIPSVLIVLLRKKTYSHAYAPQALLWPLHFTWSPSEKNATIPLFFFLRNRKKSLQ